MNDMQVIYGLSGRPVGSVEGDDLFDEKGNQIAFLEDGLLFDAETGACHGSYVNGVVYNVHGSAEGFTRGAKPGVAMLGPTLSSLPPKLKSRGSSVADLAHETPPSFFARLQQSRAG